MARSALRGTLSVLFNHTEMVVTEPLSKYRIEQMASLSGICTRTRQGRADRTQRRSGALSAGAAFALAGAACTCRPLRAQRRDAV